MDNKNKEKFFMPSPMYLCRPSKSVGKLCVNLILARFFVLVRRAEKAWHKLHTIRPS
jgi:hypothetical protein